MLVIAKEKPAPVKGFTWVEARTYNRQICWISVSDTQLPIKDGE